MLDVPAELLGYRPRPRHADREQKLTCRDQTILALRWFRDGALGRARGLPRDLLPGRRRGVDVLYAQAPDLPETLEQAMAESVPFVILDGKVFEIDRLAETVTCAQG